MEVLSIISTSWPIAAMFIAWCAAWLVFYVISWRKQSEAEDKAWRASQATNVPARRDY